MTWSTNYSRTSDDYDGPVRVLIVPQTEFRDSPEIFSLLSSVQNLFASHRLLESFC